MTPSPEDRTYPGWHIWHLWLILENCTNSEGLSWCISITFWKKNTIFVVTLNCFFISVSCQQLNYIWSNQTWATAHHTVQTRLSIPLIHTIFTYRSESQFWTIPIILLFWHLCLHELSLCVQYGSEIHLFSRTISIQSVNINRASMEYTQNSDFCSLQSEILSIKNDPADNNGSFKKVKVILLTMMGLLRKWKWDCWQGWVFLESESGPADNDGSFKKMKVSQLYISDLTNHNQTISYGLKWCLNNEEEDDNWWSFKGFIIKWCCVTSVFSEH